jgi:hypothetical protein
MLYLLPFTVHCAQLAKGRLTELIERLAKHNARKILIALCLLLALLGLSACVFGDLSEYESTGAPEFVGCADGQREGFLDIERFDDLAGCALTLSNPTSMLKQPTGVACGDDFPEAPPCRGPEDACAVGWHICLRDGKLGEIRSIITAIECQLADELRDGSFSNLGFVAAGSLAYGSSDRVVCDNDVSAGDRVYCGDNSEGKECLLCCGGACEFVTTSEFASGLWGPIETPVHQVDRCDSLTLTAPIGVLCCKDASGEVTQ